MQADLSPPLPGMERVIYGAATPGAPLSGLRLGGPAMSETERIWNQLQRSFEGNEAWRCPSLRDLLAEVTAAQAAAHPIAGAPSIFELLLHTTAYEKVACRRLAGESVASLPDALAWPKPQAASNDAWLRARLDFGDARRALRQAVAAFPEAGLAEHVPGPSTAST